jgi:hypothetical protein
LQAFKRIGQLFGEFDSDSAAMIVLEGDRPLGADASFLRHSGQARKGFRRCERRARVGSRRSDN